MEPSSQPTKLVETQAERAKTPSKDDGTFKRKPLPQGQLVTLKLQTAQALARYRRYATSRAPPPTSGLPSSKGLSQGAQASFANKSDGPRTTSLSPLRKGDIRSRHSSSQKSHQTHPTSLPPEKGDLNGATTEPRVTGPAVGSVPDNRVATTFRRIVIEDSDPGEEEPQTGRISPLIENVSGPGIQSAIEESDGESVKYESARDEGAENDSSEDESTEQESSGEESSGDDSTIDDGTGEQVEVNEEEASGDITVESDSRTHKDEPAGVDEPPLVLSDWDYSRWQGKPSRGVLIPPSYQLHDHNRFCWICPLRDCRFLFESLTGLGAHFSGFHRGLSLNDNGDGTLSADWNLKRGRGPSQVRSQQYLGPHQLPPMAVPQLAPHSKYKLEHETIQPALPQAKQTHPTNTGRSRKSLPEAKQTHRELNALRQINAFSQPRTNTGQFRKSEDGTSRGQQQQREQATSKATGVGSPASATTELENWAYTKKYVTKTPWGADAIPQTCYIPALLRLHRERDAAFNPTHSGFSDKVTNNVAALILYVTGMRAPQGCSRCSEGRGVFDGCYVLPTSAPLSLRRALTCCASCLYNYMGRSCELNRVMKQTWPELRPVQSPATKPSAIKPPKPPALLPAPVPAAKAPAQRDTPRSEKAAPAVAAASLAPRRSVRRVPEASGAAPGPSPASRERQRTTAQQNSGSQVSAATAETTLAAAVPQLDMANPADMLQLETWEVAPGRIRNEASPIVDNIAFSNAYLAQNQAVRITRDVSFQVVTVKPGTAHAFEGAADRLRLCSVAAGKVRVRMLDREFHLGPHGMFKVGPDTHAVAANMLYIDATIHVSVMPGNL
ncbi:hypothetical protein GGR56DRAFT_203086 [Xylariaceae sp. FL0804]|nr:hypothetical protein GGR56DRAFT_203086 [Xylariaceae sp. FL0804]